MARTALLIDFDGVIRRWRTGDAPIERDCGLPPGAIRQVAFSPPLLRPAITGAVSDEVWRRATASELQRRHPESSAPEAVARWSASLGEIDPDVLAVLARCRPRLRLVLATNATTRLAGDLDALGLWRFFDAVANSSELGVAKPAAEFFRAALDRAGVVATEALFIDDTAPNVEAAAAMGMLAHHFVGPEKMLRFLREEGVLAERAP